MSKSDEFPEIRENKNPEKFAGFIYKAFRCQVTHKGQTDGEFLINDEGKFSINQHGYNSTTINRTKFHLAVCEAFIRYCNQLKEPAETLLRKNFIKKMNSICGVK